MIRRGRSVARRRILQAALAAPALARASAASSSERSIWTGGSDQSVWGYFDKHSVVPGEGFDAMLSTGPAGDEVEGRLEFFRVGHHPGGQRLVWTSPPLAVESRKASRTAAAIGAAWPASLVDVPTADWAPGCYSADFVASRTGKRDAQIAQIVVRNPRRSGQILLKLGTNTYQAYNAWGGHSLYPSEDEAERGAIVSFDRPMGPALFEYEVYLVRWLEEVAARRGIAVDYVADFDLHSDPSLAEIYPLLISGSHDEYWSKEEYDAFEHRIFGAGRATIFFGANAAYWQVRYADVNRPPGGVELGRQLVTYKSLDDPIARRSSATDPALLVTARFRDGARRPETMLMGVGFQSWFEPYAGVPRRYPYRVATLDAPFFAGTGWQPGDVAADVVGYEWDNRDPDGDGARLWHADRSRNALLAPERLTVLFEGTPIDQYGRPGRAEAVYFESPAGAKVFSAGSVRWAWGLGKPGFEQPAFRRFNENLLDAFLA